MTYMVQNDLESWRDDQRSGFIAEKLLEVVLKEKFNIPQVSPDEALSQEDEGTKGTKYTRVVFARTTMKQDMNGLGDFVFYVPKKGWIRVDLGTDLRAEEIEKKKQKDEKNGLEPLFISFEQIKRASQGCGEDLNQIYDNIVNLLTG
jgi:hypothetical protein